MHYHALLFIPDSHLMGQFIHGIQCKTTYIRLVTLQKIKCLLNLLYLEPVNIKVHISVADSFCFKVTCLGDMKGVQPVKDTTGTPTIPRILLI